MWEVVDPVLMAHTRSYYLFSNSPDLSQVGVDLRRPIVELEAYGGVRAYHWRWSCLSAPFATKAWAVHTYRLH